MQITLVPIRHEPPLVTLATRGLTEAAHPELHLTVRDDRVPPQLVHWLAQALAAPVLEGGESWRPGEIVPFGWSTLRFSEAGGALVVELRDPATGAYGADLSELLTFVGRANDLLERLDLLEHGRYPHAEHTAAWPATGAVVRGVRHEPAGEASGWAFTPEEPPGTEPIALWQVADAHPTLLPALALPVGSEVELVQGRLVAITDPFGRETRL